MACIKTKKYVVELFNNLVNIFPQTGGGGGLEKCLQESHFSWYLLQIWNINSWDMWLSTHYFSGFLQDWFHVFLYEIKKNSVWYNFYQGTSVSITFYMFEHYQLWMMDSKAQRVFFPKTPQLCVWHTEVRRCYHFKLVSHFQLWFPIWGVQVNRLIKCIFDNILNLFFILIFAVFILICISFSNCVYFYSFFNVYIVFMNFYKF